MKNHQKKGSILLFLLFSGLIILLCTHLTMRPMQLSTPTTSENQNIGSSTARYDFKQIFNFYEGDLYESCEIQGDLLYLAGISGLTIFNISVPTAIAKITNLNGLGWCYDLAIQGNFAYMASDAFGLVVVNITNLTSPQYIGSFSAVNNPRQIKVVGNVAYLCYDSTWFSTINITSSDPQNFTILHTISAGGAQDLEIVDDVAYVCQGRLNEDVRRLNISDPTNIINIWPELDANDAMAVKVVGGIAYIADEFNGLVVYNITDPDSPVQIGRYIDVGGAYDIEIRSNLAYIADGFDGLELLDISNPANPKEQGSFPIGRACLHVRVVNETIYILHGSSLSSGADTITILQQEYNILHPEGVAQAITGWGGRNLDVTNDLVLTPALSLKIYNVSDHTNITFVSEYYKDTMNIHNVRANGALAYVLRLKTGTTKGFEIVNISNPGSPVGLGVYENIQYRGGFELTDATNADIDFLDSLVIIRTPPEILVLNVSNPLVPTKVGNYSIPSSELFSMAVHGDLVYVSHSSGIRVINFSNPALPVEIYVSGSYGNNQIFIEDDFLYVKGYSDLYITNISNPSNITPLGSYHIKNGLGIRMFIVDSGLAYISSDPFLEIANVRDPLNPEYLGYCSLGDMVNKIRIKGDYIYAAYISEGFKIIRIDEDTDFDGVIDFREVYEFNTDPLSSDSDQDGISDGAELYTHNTNPIDTDSDEDGLSDGSEILTYGTDPKINDTDSDGIYDKEEVIYGVDGYITDPNLVDTDGDGIDDQEELLAGLDTFITNPISNDTDGDGMRDGWEVQYNLNPTSALDASQDPDGDHITNLQEFTISSNPTTAIDNDSDLMADDWELFHGIDNPLSDHDNDSLTALQEFMAGTHPHSNDTDGDTMDDFWEVFYRTNPLIDDRLGDLDNDELINLQEYYWGTDPTLSDTDGDGFKDGFEVSSQTDPLDGTDHPPLPDYTLFIVIIIIIGTIAALLYLRTTGRLYRKAPINVFISHAVPDFKTHKVGSLAKRVSDLKAVNRSFYCEEDLQFNIDAWIKETVPLSQVLIFIATENSLQSKDCEKEILLAKKNDLFIIPLKDLNLDWENLKVGRTKLSREFGFTYDPKKASQTFKEISAYINKFKAALDELYVETRKSKEISFKKLQNTLDLSEDQIRKLVDTLDKLHRIKGAWSKNKISYLPEKEVKRRVRAISELHLTDSVTEIIEKADLHPDSKDLVEHILKVKMEKKALSQKIDMLAPYKTD